MNIHSGPSPPGRNSHIPPKEIYQRRPTNKHRQPFGPTSSPGPVNPSIISHNEMGVHNMCKDFVPTKDMLSVLSKGLKMIP